MHTIQNKEYQVLIIYNQLNAITCLKCRTKLGFSKIKLYLCI